MKTLTLLLLTLSTTSALAAPVDFGHWSGIVKSGGEANYNCYITSCEEASPALSTVNCQNLDNIDFSVSHFSGGKAPGYLWLTYMPDGPTADDAALAREYTIDGIFDATSFNSTGPFKDPTMGSNHRVPLKSMHIDMLGFEGATARATIDFGGTSPLKMDLKCCTPGDECSGRDVDDNDHSFQNPPELCPSGPKEARDECMGRNR